MGDFYKPRLKYEFVDWLVEHYRRVKDVNWRDRFVRMKKNRLEAIYCSIVSKKDENRVPIMVKGGE